jgi:hypothetical protein
MDTLYQPGVKIKTILRLRWLQKLKLFISLIRNTENNQSVYYSKGHLPSMQVGVDEWL